MHGLFIVSDWTRWSATESFSQTQTYTYNSWKGDITSTAPKSKTTDHCQGDRNTNSQGPGRIVWDFAVQSCTTITVHICALTPHSRDSLFLFPLFVFIDHKRIYVHFPNSFHLKILKLLIKLYKLSWLYLWYVNIITLLFLIGKLELWEDWLELM